MLSPADAAGAARRCCHIRGLARARRACTAGACRTASCTAGSVGVGLRLGQRIKFDGGGFRSLMYSNFSRHRTWGASHQKPSIACPCTRPEAFSRQGFSKAGRVKIGQPGFEDTKDRHMISWKHGSADRTEQSRPPNVLPALPREYINLVGIPALGLNRTSAAHQAISAAVLVLRSEKSSLPRRKTYSDERAWTMRGDYDMSRA